MLEDRYYMRQPDFEPRRSATVMLLIANVVAFVLECVFYGFPINLSRPPYLALSWAGLRHGYVWQLLTYQFLHGGPMHLLLNCWAIYVFGRELERLLGAKRFLTLYFWSGILGGLTQVLAGAIAEHLPLSARTLHFMGPTVGASAGAFGLVAAFAMLFPDRTLTLLLFFILPISLPAKALLIISALFALFGILFPLDNVADAAHLGGMVAGVLFIRYAMNWQWRWPRLGRERGPAKPRLVRVTSGQSPSWGHQAGTEEDLPPDEFLSKEVDPILDKISAHGIQSLTDRERRVLQAARDRMTKR